MKTIRTLVGRLREFKTASILTPLFIIGEVVLECSPWSRSWMHSTAYP